MRWLLASVFFSGCAVNTAEVWRPATYPAEGLNAEALGIALEDARDSVTEREFHVPFMTWPWQGASKQVALQGDVRAALHDKAQRLLGGGAAMLLFDARVVRGVAGWHGHAWSEEAFAEVEIEVSCFAARGHTWLASSSGQAFAHVHSADTNGEQPIALFDQAVLRAFEEAITRPLFVRLVNRSLCLAGQGPCRGDDAVPVQTAIVEPTSGDECERTQTDSAPTRVVTRACLLI